MMTGLLWFVMITNIICIMFLFDKTFTSKTTPERLACFVAMVFHASNLYLLASNCF